MSSTGNASYAALFAELPQIHWHGIVIGRASQLEAPQVNGRPLPHNHWHRTVPDTVPLAVPDDRLVVIESLERPGGDLDGEPIVIGIDAAAANLTGGVGERATVLYLEGDFPAGTYERVAAITISSDSHQTPG
jgi:hypothetical protein